MRQVETCRADPRQEPPILTVGSRNSIGFHRSWQLMQPDVSCDRSVSNTLTFDARVRIGADNVESVQAACIGSTPA